MDIVTHGMMGMILASPFAQSSPVAASCFALGTVAPDLDALSRLFGKRAFLWAHQTYSHSIPVILVLGGLAWAAFAVGGTASVTPPLALVLGMLFHSVLDVTNTYGIMLFAPLSRRRVSTEWVFFIDFVVIAVTIPLLIIVWTQLLEGRAGWRLPTVYGVFMIVYWLIKFLFRRHARRISGPGRLSLLPSALIPWHFLAYASEGAKARTFRLNAWSGAVTDEQTVHLLDEEWLPRIGHIPEVEAMRELSSAYHVVEAAEGSEGTTLTCRDLRTRNFRTRFGELNLLLDRGGSVRDLVFHV